MTTNKELILQAQSKLDSGNPGVAIQICEIVLAQDPTNADALHITGAAYKSLGEYSKALSFMRKSVSGPRPRLVHIHHLASAYLEVGKSEDARAWFERYTVISPKEAHGWNNLGLAYLKLGNFAEAVKKLKRGAQLDRRNATFWSNYGVALQASGDAIAAEMAFRKALEIAPQLADATLSLAILLAKAGRAKEAVLLYGELIERGVNLGMALDNCANLELSLGRYQAAESMYSRAVELLPDSLPTWNNWLFCLLHCAGTPPAAVIEAHRRFAAHFEAPFSGVQSKHDNDRDPERCLNIGIVSADLRNHVVAYFIEPLLIAMRDLPGLKLHAYSNHPVEDMVSVRLKQHFSTWTMVSSLNDEDLAATVRRDKIDILVDLSGHTFGNRLLTFARKPAPIQVSWLGYPGTTGLRAMDYYFGDRFFLPEGLLDNQFSEQIARLPSTIVFKPYEDAPPVNPLPALTNGYVTFASFSHLRKVSRQVVALWAELMRAVPDSRLLVGGVPKEESESDVRVWFQEEGIDGSRLDFHKVCPIDEFLLLHHQVDIHLDPFPYNGGTTTWHAIRMGVPSLSLVGATSAGRSGASILGLVGRSDFVASSKDEYVALGKSWASRLEDLAALRSNLRSDFEKSLPSQAVPTAKGIEMAWRHMWRRWCEGQPAESFEITEEQVR